MLADIGGACAISIVPRVSVRCGASSASPRQQPKENPGPFLKERGIYLPAPSSGGHQNLLLHVGTTNSRWETLKANGNAMERWKERKSLFNRGFYASKLTSDGDTESFAGGSRWIVNSDFENPLIRNQFQIKFVRAV